VTRDELSAMQKKYHLLDGSLPEHQPPLPTDEERARFFDFASDVFSVWITLPQAEAILMQETLARAARQKEFLKFRKKV
jgi:hypothetical protein